MTLLGVLVTLLGFLVSVASLTFSSSVMGRLIIVLIGIAVSLIGIIGIINPAYMREAIWRK